VEASAKILRDAGIEVSVAPTLGSVETSQQARQAAAEGFDAVFACGGDGTIHEVMQGLVGTSTALGILPFGTANALARDLRLPLTAANAANAALKASVRRIAVGKIEYQAFSGERQSRYFTVTAGIGVDALLFYKLNLAVKNQLGMISYYAKATHLWATHPMDRFAVEIVEGGRARQASVSQLLAVRIRNFGGVLRELAPGASLDRQDLRLVLFHTRSRILYLSYILRGLLGTPWRSGEIELANAQRVDCRLADDSAHRVYVEADGELVGTVPATISMVPDALSLLAP
jgi:YegS/Rv2252/BmrU family lipid kinase